MGRGLWSLSLGLALVAIGCAEETFPAPPEEILTSPAAVRRGAEIYRKNCAICHGPQGHGDGPQARSLDPAPADLRRLNGVRADPGYWFYRIKHGGKKEPLARARSAMPSWGQHLEDEEIWKVVAYLKGLVGGSA